MKRTSQKPVKTDKVVTSGKKPRGKGKPFVSGDPRANTTIAGPGRPPNWYKELCEKRLSMKSHRKAVQRVLKNPNHPAFLGLTKEMADRAFGKANQSLDVKASITLEELVARSHESPSEE